RILRSLLDAGAEVNAQGGEYGAALQAASARGREQVVKTLDVGAHQHQEVNTGPGSEQHRSGLKQALSGA
ncbi:hypothetical protein CC77DRAFT_938961, partial [Alternaria alternata]